MRTNVSALCGPFIETLSQTNKPTKQGSKFYQIREYVLTYSFKEDLMILFRMASNSTSLEHTPGI